MATLIVLISYNINVALRDTKVLPKHGYTYCCYFVQHLCCFKGHKKCCQKMATPIVVILYNINVVLRETLSVAKPCLHICGEIMLHNCSLKRPHSVAKNIATFFVAFLSHTIFKRVRYLITQDSNNAEL